MYGPSVTPKNLFTIILTIHLACGQLLVYYFMVKGAMLRISYRQVAEKRDTFHINFGLSVGIQ